MCIERWRPARAARAALAGAALTLGSVACNGRTSYLDATGSAGAREALLGRWLTGIALAVVVIVAALVIAGMMRHREGDAGQVARGPVASGLRWIYAGLAVTVVILLVTFAGTMATLQAASHPPAVPSLTVDVTAHQWWWEVRYEDPKEPFTAFVTANEMHLPVGVPVRLRLHAADVIHSFWVPQLAGKIDVVPGQVNEGWLLARQPGTSRGMCGEYCGLQHAMMAFPVTAESPAAFARWAAARRAAPPPPATEMARVGQGVFARACGSCHAVTGSNVIGRLGPDLSHLASRPTIGAGVLTNTPEHLARWIRHAPEVKEGARMPEIPLDDAQLRAVVAYLQTLR